MIPRLVHGFAVVAVSSMTLGGCVLQPLFVEIDSGGSSSCGLQSNDRVRCWGGSLDNDAEPAEALVDVSVGQYEACGIRASDGTLHCWGYSDWDDWVVPPDGGFIDIAVGSNHACGVRADGTLECWGDNEKLQSDPPAGDDYEWVEVQSYYSCAIRAGGQAECWGELYYDVPVQAPAFEYLEIAIGTSNACGLVSSGKVHCWGDVYPLDPQDPEEVETWSFDMAEIYVDLVAGDNHFCAIVADDGATVCWGEDGLQQASPPATAFVQLSAGDDHTCGLLDDGSVECWGAEASGQAEVPKVR